MVINVLDRPDLVKIEDLITNRESSAHASHLKPSRSQRYISLECLVAADLDKFYVGKIIGHSGAGENPKKC